jgi:hypothetical protein
MATAVSVISEARRVYSYCSRTCASSLAFLQLAWFAPPWWIVDSRADYAHRCQLQLRITEAKTDDDMAGAADAAPALSLGEEELITVDAAEERAQSLGFSLETRFWYALYVSTVTGTGSAQHTHRRDHTRTGHQSRSPTAQADRMLSLQRGPAAVRQPTNCMAGARSAAPPAEQRQGGADRAGGTLHCIEACKL